MILATYILRVGDDEILLYGTPSCLEEAKKNRGRIHLTGRYSARKDSPHLLPPLGKYHIHVNDGRRELFAINKDGTAHDDSHGVVIPNRVADALRRLFPDFNIPANNIIEGLSSSNLTTLLLEIAADSQHNNP